MRAVVVTEAGGPEVLQIEEHPDPTPGPGQAVVRLAAANINPTDVGARQGMFPPGFGIEGPPYVLGWDLAGEVVAVGEGVGDPVPGGGPSPADDPDGGGGPWSVGDQVVAMIPWYVEGGRLGAYQELVLLDAAWLVARPEGLDPVTAATVPLNALTAQQAIGHLGAPEGAEILVTGASGAVGSFAVQIAVAEGLRVVAVAGTDDEEWVRGLGAARVLPRDTDLSTVGTFTYVLDAVPVGAEVFPAVADGGTIVTTRPVQDEPGRRIVQRPMLIEQDVAGLEQLIQGVAGGALLTRVSQTVPLAEAARAHELVEERGRKGKVVLVP